MAIEDIATIPFHITTKFHPFNSSDINEAEKIGLNKKQLCPIWIDNKHLLSFANKLISNHSDFSRATQIIRCASNMHMTTDKIKDKTDFLEFNHHDKLLLCNNQELAFETTAKPIISNVLNGKNGIILAYGERDTGKTFTMFGAKPFNEKNSKLFGIVPRSFDYLFNLLSNDNTNINIKSYTIDILIIEINKYSAIRDLLHPAKKTR